MSSTGAAIAVLLAFLIAWRGRWRKASVVMAVVAAAAVGGLGPDAMLGDVADRLDAGVRSASVSVSNTLFDVEVPYLIPVFLIGVVILDMMRGATATRLTMYAAILAVWSLDAVGGEGGRLLADGLDEVVKASTAFLEGVFTDPRSGGGGG